MEEITADGVYLIGTVYPKEQHFYLMSSKKQSNWLDAVDNGHVDDAPTLLSVSDDSCKWVLARRENDYWVIKPYGRIGMLWNNQTKSINHIYTSETDSTMWTIVCSEGGFYFSTVKDTDYYIAFKLSTSGARAYMRFGFYKDFDVNRLIIYKLITDDATDEAARATPMSDGATVAICSKSALATADLTTMSPDGYMLKDGTVAADERVGRWIYESRGDSCFVLKNAEGRYLACDLQPSETEQTWCVSNGRILTNGDIGATRPRALCYDNGFKLVDVDSIKTERRVRFREVVQPDSTINGDIKTLSDGWSRGRLAAMSWEGVQTLDLTNISLPVAGLTDFVNRPTEANTIIYISKESAELVPTDWNFTVVRREEGDTLLTTTLLHDRERLCVAKDISYSAGQLSYQRALYDDTAWETLYVPFNADVDDDYELYQFKSIADDALKFEKGRAITAYTPLLLRRTSESASTTFLVKASTDGVLQSSTTDTSGMFFGTLTPINISSELEGKYLLNTAGEAFQLAGAGSTLKPFRAYIQQSYSSSTLRLLLDDEATNIDAAAMTDDDTTAHPCYTIDGRLIAPQLTRKAAQHLPRGVYIYDGQTLIIK